jgi:hypothetical protein
VRTLRNIFACLVHESEECVVDLVRNLRALDPASAVLLYNGSGEPELLNNGFPFARYAVKAHPSPRRLSWGKLHDFALDCMEFALGTDGFDTLTIVDSDQLCTRSGYSDYLSHFLADKSRVGMLSSSPGCNHLTPVLARLLPHTKKLNCGERFYAASPTARTSLCTGLSGLPPFLLRMLRAISWIFS